ncbi:DUF4396 domain-containing protein [Pantoea sp.]|uniref:DUF4396 domain-containing protein n=1 Tax=Pantoea sp. TaxID=69393 RepID=UPI0028A0A743|nr:DUF4396 domain-containing protein [Pantoea sp.]
MPVFGWFVWRKWGKSADQHSSDSSFDKHHNSQPHSVDWRAACVSATHCGAGCVIGDILAAPVAALTHFSLAGSAFFGHTLLSYVAAFFVGILFQYLPMREMGEKSRSMALVKAIKADTISLTVFQAGMFLVLWLFRQTYTGDAPEINSMRFWGEMIVAMFIGYVISVPANAFLIKKGIKHAM